ncbi:MAG: hypothetical protein ACKVOW_11895 [Chitinophagaceae bacterium]
MIVTIVLFFSLIYLAAGFIFAIAFLIKGIRKVDENIHGSSKGFFFVIIPGVMVFWPFLLKKWMQASRNKHKQ